VSAVPMLVSPAALRNSRLEIVDIAHILVFREATCSI
jgi:hypothetical protein